MVIKSTVKAIPLHQLSPDAFTLVSGASESALPIDRLYKRIAWLRRAVDVRADAIGNMPFAPLDSVFPHVKSVIPAGRQELRIRKGQTTATAAEVEHMRSAIYAAAF